EANVHPAKAEPSPLARAMGNARDLIREATPEFCDLADQADATSLSEGELLRLLARAREDYAGILAEAPNRPVLELRIRILGDLITSLQSYRDRCADGR